MNYQALQDIGLSLNEAKVYLSLLSDGRAMNGYEVAKIADITRTMVYDVLNRLVAKRYVEIVETTQRLYSAVPYKQVIDEIKRENERKIETLESVLQEQSSNTVKKHYIYNLMGTGAAIRAIKDYIADAKKEIYLCLWAQEAELIKEELQQAHNRGVKVYSFSFNKLPYSFGQQYVYGFKWDGEMFFLRRRITVIIDKSIMVMSEADNAFEEINIVTKNTMLIETAIDSMLLDIWHLSTYKKEGLLTEGMTYDEYKRVSQKMLGIYNVPKDLPSGL